MVSTKNKSEEKDIKLTVFYRKMVFFSSFCGNLINFVRVLYIKGTTHLKKNGK